VIGRQHLAAPTTAFLAKAAGNRPEKNITVFPKQYCLVEEISCKKHFRNFILKG
jgi:hypothetical protein